MTEKTKNELSHEKMQAEINKILAQTIKLNKDIRWYEIAVIVALTLAIVAVVKLFI